MEYEKRRQIEDVADEGNKRSEEEWDKEETREKGKVENNAKGKKIQVGGEEAKEEDKK